MRVHVLAYGKLKTPGLREAADHYIGMGRAWVRIEEIELRPQAVSDKSPAARKKIQDEETVLLQRRMESLGRARSGTSGASHAGSGTSMPYYLLDERGSARSTAQWAKLAQEWERLGHEPIFCIGSSLGFSDELRARAAGLFSFGVQTLPHELARVVLYEQIFRAWSVIKGHPYHNAD